MQANPDQVMHIVATVIAFYAVIGTLVLVAIVIPTWFICKKAGFSPWLSFLVIVPFGGIVLLYVLAFADWKVLPAKRAMWPPPPYPPPQESYAPEQAFAVQQPLPSQPVPPQA